MIRCAAIILAVFTVAATTHLAAEEGKPSPLAHRWVYVPTNLLVDKNVERNLKLFERAAKAGYNGILLADSKFMRWDLLPEHYLENVRRTREACRRLKLDVIACVCPIGSSNDLLSRDPNLAEGLTVVDAPFVAQCIKMVRGEDPGKPIYAWSDMFDPWHNAAKTGKYYLLRGDGPWYGSWEGLDKDVVIVNWNSNPAKRAQSLAHFARRGQEQILAGYYDGPVGAIAPWLDDARRVGGLVGAMYTTWQGRYDDLEAFAAELNKPR